MVISARIFLILLVSLLLRGAPTPTNDGNRNSSIKTTWIVDGVLPAWRPNTHTGGNQPPPPGPPPSPGHEEPHLSPGHEEPLPSPGHEELPPSPGHEEPHPSLGQTVLADTRQRDHRLPPTSAVRFADVTTQFINNDLVPKTCRLPAGSWYRTKMGTTYLGRVVTRIDAIAATPQGLIVLLLKGTIVSISDSDKIEVPSDETIRVIEVPDVNRNRIWDECEIYYKEQVKTGLKVFPLKQAMPKFHYLRPCFDANLRRCPNGFVEPGVVFYERLQKGVTLPPDQRHHATAKLLQ